MWIQVDFENTCEIIDRSTWHWHLIKWNIYRTWRVVSVKYTRVLLGVSKHIITFSTRRISAWPSTDSLFSIYLGGSWLACLGHWFVTNHYKKTKILFYIFEHRWVCSFVSNLIKSNLDYVQKYLLNHLLNAHNSKRFLSKKKHL